MISPHGETAIFLPLVVGAAATFCTLVIHVVAVMVIVRIVRYERRLDGGCVRFHRDVAIVAATAHVTLSVHLIGMAVWAVVFVLCREFSGLAPAFYHSAVNYTSLGYGDVVMSESWKLLAPLETADARLMFGVSTATVFAVIQQLLQRHGGLGANP